MPDSARALCDLKIDREHAPLKITVLRVRTPSPYLYERLGKIFELNWPQTPCKSAGGVYCTGPNEWVVIGRERDDVARRIDEACSDALHHLVHIGAGRALWRISGARAPDLMARGAALDFHPRAFVAGDVAQSLFAQIPALIARPNETVGYELVTDASYDHHLQLWFGQAARDL